MGVPTSTHLFEANHRGVDSPDDPNLFSMAEMGCTPVVADAAARDALFPTPQGDEKLLRKDFEGVERFDSIRAKWRAAFGDPTRGSGASSLMAALADGVESVAIQVLSDSTANDPTEWPYLTAQFIGVLFPNYTVNYIVYDDPSQTYTGVVTRIQTGTAGERYAQFNGSQGAGANATTSLSLPYSEIPFPTGDLDVRFRIDPTTWTPSVIKMIAGLFGSAGNRSWRISVNTTGTALQYQHSVDGTTLVTSTSGNTGGVAGTPMWLRVVHQMDDGAAHNLVSFYKSADGLNGTNWTLINTVTNAGAIAGGLFAASNAFPGWEIGGRQQTVDLFDGKFYGIDIRNGINGVPIAPQLPDNWLYQPTTVQPVFNGAPILTMVNGSVAGAGITYLSDSVRMPKMTPKYGQCVIILATSHNDDPVVGNSLLSTWDSWLTALKSRFPAAQIAVLIQSPEISPAPNTRQKKVRRRQLIAWAARNACDLMDGARAFTLDGRDPTLLISADGIHPNTAGSALYAIPVQAYFWRGMY